MNNDIKELIYYIVAYGDKNNIDITLYRLYRTIYLIDWVFCINRNRQFTNIIWFFDNYCPYSKNILSILKNNNDLFYLIKTKDEQGVPRIKIKLLKKFLTIEFSDDDKYIINFVLSKTSSFSQNELKNLVYNTYPLKTTKRYSFFNILEKAREYKKLKKENN